MTSKTAAMKTTKPMLATSKTAVMIDNNSFNWMSSCDDDDGDADGNSNFVSSTSTTSNVTNNPAAPASAISSLSRNGSGEMSSALLSPGNIQPERRRVSSTRPIPRVKRESSTKFELTIDKLDYRNLSFSGRDQELETLRGVFASAQQSSQRKHLVWIHGESGTGKTSLVRHVITEEKKRQRREEKRSSRTDGVGPLYVTGKFDDRSMDSRNDVPYSGLGICCGEMCSTILSMASSSDPHQRRRFEVIRKSMEDAVGASGLETLMTVIPALAEIVDVTATTTRTSVVIDAKNKAIQQEGPRDPPRPEQNERQEPTSAESSKNRLNFGFQSWIKVVIKFFSPLVIVLDDLQWADDASLALLEALMRERSLLSLVVVGIYRSNNVDDKHPVTRVKRTLAELSIETDQNLDIAEIPVANLDLSAIHDIVRDLLTLDDDPARTLGLAELCRKKTNGNVFFLLQYMEMLHRSQLLQFNLGSLKWMWDEQAIVLQTEATDNVVSLLQSKMECLDADQRQLLPLAASLGTTFSERVIGMVWNHLREENDNNDGSSDDRTNLTAELLTKALTSFEADGYIESFSDGKYRWAHDRIREAASSLVEDAPSFYRQVGEIMLSTLDDGEKESLIFDIVALLNHGTEPVGKARRLTQARLNLNATRKAIESSAFGPASKTAARGTDLLNHHKIGGIDGKWLEHYELCLELHSLGAQAEGYLGNVKTMEAYCSEVLAQKSKPLQDKFRVYDVLVDSLANRGQLKDAVDILLSVLSECGCHLPARGSVSVMPKTLWNVVKIKRKLNRNWFDNLEPMNDALRVELVRFLNRLITYFYLLEDDRMPLAVFQMLKWTIKYGYCEYSTIAIGFTGVIFISAMNDLQSARICLELTQVLVDKLGLRVPSSRLTLIVHGFLQHWSTPLRDSLTPLLNGYEAGLKSGDTESASWCIYHFCLLRFFSGDELGALEKDLRAYCVQTADLQRLTPSYLIAYVWQAVLNIQGRAKGDCLILDGDAVDAKEYSRLMNDAKMKFVLSAYYLSLAILYCYLGAHEKLANLTCEIGYDYIAKVFPGTLCPVIDIYVKGVSCYAAARESNNKKFAKMGKKCLSQLRSWCKNGDVNVQHQLALVEAECAAYHGHNDKALGLYLTALRTAARSGFLHHAGLASERLCQLYMAVLSDKEEAKFRFGEAKRYYSDWGAVAKVELLEAAWGAGFEPTISSEIVCGSNSLVSLLPTE